MSYGHAWVIRDVCDRLKVGGRRTSHLVPGHQCQSKTVLFDWPMQAGPDFVPQAVRLGRLQHKNGVRLASANQKPLFLPGCQDGLPPAQNWVRLASANQEVAAINVIEQLARLNEQLLKLSGLVATGALDEATYNSLVQTTTQSYTQSCR